MRELELLCFVTGQLLPEQLTLVPLQLVVGDGGAVVLGCTPAQGQRVLASAGHPWWAGLGWRFGWDDDEGSCDVVVTGKYTN